MLRDSLSSSNLLCLHIIETFVSLAVSVFSSALFSLNAAGLGAEAFDTFVTSTALSIGTFPLSVSTEVPAE